MSDTPGTWENLFGLDPDWPVSDAERDAHELRIILTDLIAELREAPRANRAVSTNGVHWALPCIDSMIVDPLLDRAEQRLKGLATRNRR